MTTETKVKPVRANPQVWKLAEYLWWNFGDGEKFDCILQDDYRPGSLLEQRRREYYDKSKKLLYLFLYNTFSK